MTVGDENTDNTQYSSQYCTGGISLIGGDVQIGDNIIIGVNSMVVESVDAKEAN